MHRRPAYLGLAFLLTGCRAILGVEELPADDGAASSTSSDATASGASSATIAAVGSTVSSAATSASTGGGGSAEGGGSSASTGTGSGGVGGAGDGGAGGDGGASASSTGGGGAGPLEIAHFDLESEGLRLDVNGGNVVVLDADQHFWGFDAGLGAATRCTKQGLLIEPDHPGSLALFSDVILYAGSDAIFAQSISGCGAAANCACLVDEGTSAASAVVRAGAGFYATLTESGDVVQPAFDVSELPVVASPAELSTADGSIFVLQSLAVWTVQITGSIPPTSAVLVANLSFDDPLASIALAGDAGDRFAALAPDLRQPEVSVLAWRTTIDGNGVLVEHVIVDDKGARLATPQYPASRDPHFAADAELLYVPDDAGLVVCRFEDGVCKRIAGEDGRVNDVALADEGVFILQGNAVRLFPTITPAIFELLDSADP